MSTVTSARLRAYNVGFGDCFLLSFGYDRRRAPARPHRLREHQAAGAGPRPHGCSTSPTTSPRPGGKLAPGGRHPSPRRSHLRLRRADAGAVIAALRPRARGPAVDRASRPRSRRHLAGGRWRAMRRAAPRGRWRRRCATCSAFAGGVVSEGRRLQRAAGFPKTVGEHLEFLGETNLTNRAAVERLMAHGERRATPASATTSTLDDLLPGVTIDVLGPPTLEQQPSIASQATRTPPSSGTSRRRGRRRARAPADARPAPLFPDAVLRRVPQAATLAVAQIDRAHAEEMLSLLRILDDVLNNTSLILLLRDRRHDAAVPRRRPDRELELRPVRRAGRARRSASGWPRRRLQGRPPRQPQRHARRRCGTASPPARRGRAGPADHGRLDARRQARRGRARHRGAAAATGRGARRGSDLWTTHTLRKTGVTRTVVLPLE